MIADGKIELLAPAGSYEAFRAGLSAGADAFYLGGNRFGARAYADNFTEDVLLKTIDEAHLFGKRIYLTVNTLFKEKELAELPGFLAPFYRQGLDAVIVQDLGAVRLIRRIFPDLPVHASTQMTVTGWQGAKLLEEYGAKRVVPARELSIEEIEEIRDHTSLEIECFVHGALCYCYSGQCLFSSFIGGRSGNRGRCAQPCRLPYQVSDGRKTVSGARNAYALNTKDMCLIDSIPALAAAGVTSFKVEGRMKRPEYTAGVIAVYRKYLDLYEQGVQDAAVSEEDRQFLAALFNRDGFSKGYYFRHNGREMMALENKKASGARVKSADEAYETVRREILPKAEKRPVDGVFTITEARSAVLTVTDADLSAVCSSGGVQVSQNRPLTQDVVCRQLEKTGGSDFAWRSLKIDLPDDVFMTMKQLNELRRNAFEAFREKVLARYRRKMPAQAAAKCDSGTAAFPKTDIAGRTEELWVSVADRAQFAAVKTISGIDGFYIPAAVFLKAFSPEEQEQLKDRVILALPYISRSTPGCGDPAVLQKTAARGFRFLVRSLEDAAFLLQNGYGTSVRLDYTVYTMNTESLLFWQAYGVHETTVPVELNRREIAARDNTDSELILYGRIPLMVSAQCIRKNYGSCTHAYGSMKLTDRTGAEFPVSFECGTCYNIIYNSVPLSLLSRMEEVRPLRVRRLRVSLTAESAENAAKIVQAAVRAVKYGEAQKENYACTRGHFNRGVE